MAKSEIATAPDNVELAILGEGDYEIPVEDADAQSKEIAYRILSAENEDQLFDQTGTLSARDLLDVPLTIRNVRWQSSKYGEGGPKVFALVEAQRMDNGESALFTCGSRNVMAQLFQMGKLGSLPSNLPLKLIENETASGYGALWLTKA